MIRNLDELLKQLTAAYAARLDEIQKVDKKHGPVIDQRVNRLFKECFPKSKPEAVLYPLQSFRKTLIDFMVSVGNSPIPDDLQINKLMVMEPSVQFSEENHALKCHPVTLVAIIIEVEEPDGTKTDMATGQVRIPSTILELHTSLIKTELVEPIGSSGKIIKLN